jgi:hypothetical protein
MQSYTDKHVQPPDPRRQQVALQAKVTQKEVMQSKKVVLAKALLSADRRRLPTSHMLDGSEVEFSEFNDSYEAPQGNQMLKNGNYHANDYEMRHNGGNYPRRMEDYDMQKAYSTYSKLVDPRYGNDAQGNEDEDEDEERVEEDEEELSEAERQNAEHYAEQDTPTRVVPNKITQNLPNGNIYQHQSTEPQQNPGFIAAQGQTSQDPANYSTDSGNENKITRSIPQRGVPGAKRKHRLATQSVAFQNQALEEAQYSVNVDEHVNTHRPKRVSQDGKHSRPSSTTRSMAHKSSIQMFEGQQTVEVEDLDYPLDKLKEMNYLDLEQESFDVDPKAVAPDFDGLNDNLDLEEKLSKVKKFDPEQQRQFFESLPMEQWDKSGDWFLDQFAQLMGKIRDARKAKRELATKFEKEISSRHIAVEDRRKGIVKTMEDMRSGGVNTLRACSQDRV